MIKFYIHLVGTPKKVRAFRYEEDSTSETMNDMTMYFNELGLKIERDYQFELDGSIKLINDPLVPELIINRVYNGWWLVEFAKDRIGMFDEKDFKENFKDL